MEEGVVENPAIREDTGRNPDGTFKKGVSGNPSGRPKNTLKDYVRQKFTEMSDEEKEEFLKKINPEFQWKMGEGQPKQDVGMEVTVPQTLIELIQHGIKEGGNSGISGENKE